MSDPSKKTTSRQLICPVCNTLLGDIVVKLDHGAHVHYFCSDSCKAEFEKDPKKYH